MNQHECTHPHPIVTTKLSTRRSEIVTSQDHVLCRDCRLSVPLGEPWTYVYAAFGAECMAENEGWYCTRDKDHPGRHIATDSRSGYCHDWEETE